MTVQRLYNLPNCSLLLEGVGDLISLSPADARMPMSTLINVECRIAGQDKPLSGGREFLNSLVAAVSQYAQELLSGLNVKKQGRQTTTPMVEIELINETLHRLKVRSQNGDGTATVREVDLTTVQLFDLVEAVDQLLADTQTLPDLKFTLKPLSRREVAREKSRPSQVVPAAIGLAGLAAAAVAFSFLPTPKVQPPKDLYPVRQAETATSPSPTPTTDTAASPKPVATESASPSTAASPDLNALAANLTSPTEITDSGELEALGKELRTKLDNTWSDRTANTQDLIYQVGVGQDGAIRGYKPLNSTSAAQGSTTPLFTLLPRSPVETGPMALYKVVFTGSGNVEVAPWREVMTSPISGVTEITETEQLEAILSKLTTALNQNWPTEPTFNEELRFKVRVTADGTVVDYSPENDAAARYVDETPLAKLGKPIADGNTAPPDQPLAIFQVVMNPPNGTLEVSPWRGWQN